MTVSGRLVGRDAALALTGSALTGALSGAGRLLLVAGEPGIGKTALARAVAEDGRRAGAQVVWSACPPAGAPAYWSWTQVLRDVAERHPVPPAAQRLLGHADIRPAGDEAVERFELHDAVTRALGDAARDVPLVVVLDDLHWADRPSLDLLDAVARGIGGRRVLLLGTYREVEATEALTRIVGSVDGVTLGGLDGAAVLGLVTTITGTAPDAADAEALRDRTGGNPLFVREIARLLVARGSGSAALTRLPDTVAETLGRRLEALTEPCRDLLQVAAVADDSDPGLLTAVTDHDIGAVTALVDEAVMARVLGESSGHAGQRPFVHDLYREAVLAGIGPDRRRDLDASIGRALMELTTAGRPIPAARVATHLLATVTDAPELVAAAGAWAKRAAEAATASLGHVEAVRWYGQARALATSSDPGLTIALAEAQLRAGDPEARTTFSAAAAEARADGDVERLAAAALGLHRVGARGNHDEQLALLEEAVAGVPRGSAERARLLAAVARDRRHSRWSAADARGTAEEAVAEARAHGDPQLVAECLLALHDSLWEPGSSASRLPVVEQMAAAAAEAEDPELVALATVLRAACLIDANQPRGLADLATYAELADALGHARGRWEALSRRATLALITGAIEEAGSRAEEARELGVRIGIPDALGVHGTLTWPLSLFNGRRGILLAEWRDVDVIPMRSAFLAAAARAIAEHDEAHRHALTIDVDGVPNSTDLEFAALVADGLVSAGPTESARASYQSLLPYAGTNVLVGGCASYWGPVDLYLGQLAASLGDPAAAVAHLRAAEAMAATLGAPLWAAHARALANEIRQEPEPDVPRLARDGGVWTLRWGGVVSHLPDSKGLHDLELLLGRPGSEIAATELMSGRPTAGADPVLDDQAKRAYRRRLEELAEEIDDATASGDAGRAGRAQDERDALLDALASAVGLGGRDRRLGDDAERARKAVTARIRDAIRRIEDVHPELGAHLEAAVHTGNWCEYRPGDPLPQSVVR
jgi:hypothetical protein